MTTKQLTDVLDANWDVLAKSPDVRMEPTMKLLAQHLDNPRSYVTLAGETSSGKSTLINSFLGRKFLPAGAKPTTGTVTWLECGMAERERLLAINRDATIEELSIKQFHALSQNPDRNLLRLKAEMPKVRPGFVGLSVFDTPGFNAIVSEHAEVLREFLPESDVVVFPVSYKVGFGSSDQQLMELIGDIRKRLGTFPVILVVNRTPDGADENDKRIREIRLHAEDTLHDAVELVIVRSSMPTVDGESTLPQTNHLWTKVGEVVASKERLSELGARLKESISSLVDQRISEIDTELAAAKVGDEAVEELEAERRSFDAREAESYKIVDKFMKRIEREVPKLLKRGAEKLVARATAEIEESNKWTDASQCQTYVYRHVLPFCTTGVVREIEGYLFEVFEQLDSELSEMANLAVRHLNDRAQTIENPQLCTLVTNLGIRIGQRVTGGLATQAARSVSGVGGMATGVGNLVKMGVKNVGKLFGKTFSRDVYTTIGKTFTKRTVQVMSVAVQVVVEAAFVAWDANHWQGRLIEKVEQTVRDWEAEVEGEFVGKMVANYRESNYENVKACYAALRADLDSALEDVRKDYDAAMFAGLENDRQQLVAAQKKLEK